MCRRLPYLTISQRLQARQTAVTELTCIPWKLLIRHTRALSPGSYLALPFDALLLAVAAVGGMGILITTFFAFLSSGKSAVI